MLLAACHINKKTKQTNKKQCLKLPNVEVGVQRVDKDGKGDDRLKVWRIISVPNGDHSTVVRGQPVY